MKKITLERSYVRPNKLMDATLNDEIRIQQYAGAVATLAPSNAIIIVDNLPLGAAIERTLLLSGKEGEVWVLDTDEESFSVV